MSDYDYEDETDEGPKGLRAALAKANKLLAEVQKQNETLSGQVNESRLASLLSTKNVSPSIQRWIKKDGVEPTAEAVDNWLKENGEDFGWKPGGETPVKVNDAETKHESTDEPERQPRKSVLSDDEMAMLQRLNALAGEGSGPVYNADQDKANVDRIAADATPGDFDGTVNALREAGFNIGGGY